MIVLKFLELGVIGLENGKMAEILTLIVLKLMQNHVCVQVPTHTCGKLQNAIKHARIN